VLTALSHEEKMERRKERARVYSHIARRRQEGFMRDLNADVDHLDIFQSLVEEAPDAVMVLSKDREGRILFIEGAAATRLRPDPKALLGGCVRGRRRLGGGRGGVIMMVMMARAVGGVGGWVDGWMDGWMDGA
jgi:PAS domain-containing protein